MTPFNMLCSNYSEEVTKKYVFEKLIELKVRIDFPIKS